MKIIQTTGGWMASEQINNLYWRTTIHKDSGTIKHIHKESNKLIDIYTLKLEKEKFSFTAWDKLSLKTESKFRETFYEHKILPEEEIRKRHLIWGIRTLRNQEFNKEQHHTYYHITKELFNLYIPGDINYSSELAQSLYRNPGVENLEKLLFGDIANILRKSDWEWDHLEAIYNCPWQNKAEIFQNIKLEYGRYTKLFHNPEQFTNTVYKIKRSIMEQYLGIGLPKIPENLQTAPEIEEYMKNQVTEYKEPTPRSIQEIHSLLGDPIEERLRLSFNNFTLRTKEIKIDIRNILPFPILSLRGEATPEIEILLCEELGMRSHKYIPSRLKRYEL